MDLAYAYRQVTDRLSRIDFAALHRGFSPFPFALYDGERAYMDGAYFEKPAGFIGNTSVMHNGKHTAIWQLTGEGMDPDILTSKIVHEMLHAFQNASGEKRWADEREALVKYRYDALNVSARLEEAACMRACLSENNAPDAFPRLLGLRSARSVLFPYEYGYEARIEQIEGTAHFTELSALSMLDAAKGKQAWDAALSGISNPSRYYPARSVTYLTGAAFLACLRKYTSADTESFTETPFAVAALEGISPCPLPERNEKAEESLAEYRARMRLIAERTAGKGAPELEGVFRLVAMNVYDAYYDGAYAVLTAFIGYLEGNALPETDEELFAKMKILYGDFVLEMDRELRFSRAWRR